jgi:hypothetical protein
MEWGFIESLSHDAFRDPSNGFLVNDLCIFAVEVFAIKSSGSVESFIRQRTWNWSIHLRVITFQLWISMPTTLRLLLLKEETGTCRTSHKTLGNGSTLCSASLKPRWGRVSRKDRLFFKKKCWFGFLKRLDKPSSSTELSIYFLDRSLLAWSFNYV